MLLMREHACLLLPTADMSLPPDQCKEDLSTLPQSNSRAATAESQACYLWLPLHWQLVLTITYVASTILLFFGRFSQICKHRCTEHTG